MRCCIDCARALRGVCWLSRMCQRRFAFALLNNLVIIIIFYLYLFRLCLFTRLARPVQNAFLHICKSVLHGSLLFFFSPPHVHESSRYNAVVLQTFMSDKCNQVQIFFSSSKNMASHSSSGTGIKPRHWRSADEDLFFFFFSPVCAKDAALIHHTEIRAVLLFYFICVQSLFFEGEKKHCCGSRSINVMAWRDKGAGRSQWPHPLCALI